MKSVVAALAFAAASVGALSSDSTMPRRHHSSCGESYGEPGKFDIYVFQQAWSAEFCNGENYPGCSDPTQFMQGNLTIHGLWPQYYTRDNGHGWPQCCDSKFGASLNSTVVHELKSSLDKYWPNEKGGNGFWEHEWDKHGTCSGLSQMSYFTSTFAVEKQIGTPNAIVDNIGGSVSLRELEEYYDYSDFNAADGGASVSLSCHDGYLADITTCWDKDLQRTSCPSGTVKSTNCDSSVRIASFDNEDAKLHAHKTAETNFRKRHHFGRNKSGKKQRVPRKHKGSAGHKSKKPRASRGSQ